MDAATLLSDLVRRGIRLAVEGTGIRARPSAALTDSDRAAIREYKSELLRLLANGGNTSTIKPSTDIPIMATAPPSPNAHSREEWDAIADTPAQILATKPRISDVPVAFRERWATESLYEYYELVEAAEQGTLGTDMSATVLSCAGDIRALVIASRDRQRTPEGRRQANELMGTLGALDRWRKRRQARRGSNVVLSLV